MLDMIFHLLKKKKVVELRMQAVGHFLDDMEEDVAKKVDADGFFRFVEQQKERISDAAKALEGARPLAKGLPPRALHLLEGNRKHFLQEMSLLVGKVESPKDIIAAVDFYGQLVAEMDSFLRFSQKSYLVCKELLGEETALVMRRVKELEERSGSFAKRIEKMHAGNIVLIRQKLSVFHEHKAGKSELEASMEGILNDLSEIKGREEKIIRTIDKLKRSERFGVLEELQEKRTRIEQALRKEKAEFNTLFSEYEKPLKKILPGSNEEQLILSYLDNAADAISEDADLAIHAVLRSLLERDLDLPKKRETRIKKLITSMTRESLEKTRSDLSRLSDELHDVKRSLAQTESLLGVSEQEGYLDMVRSAAKDIQGKVDGLRSKITKIDESVLIDEINGLLLPLGAKISELR